MGSVKVIFLSNIECVLECIVKSFHTIMWFWGVSWLLTKIRFSRWTRIWKNIYSQILSIVNGPYLTAFRFIHWNCHSVPFYGSGLDCNLRYACSSLTGVVAACVGILWGDSANSKIPPSEHRGIASCVPGRRCQAELKFVMK